MKASKKRTKKKAPGQKLLGRLAIWQQECFRFLGRGLDIGELARVPYFFTIHYYFPKIPNVQVSEEVIHKNPERFRIRDFWCRWWGSNPHGVATNRF